MKKSIKVYIDTNIISTIKNNNIEAKELDAINLIKNNWLVGTYTSEKAKREIDDCKDEAVRSELNLAYDLIDKIPEENLLKEESAAVGVAPIGVAAIGAGSYIGLDPLLVRLRSIFDVNDAEHIFQAVKNSMDYFVTLDKKTILKRVEKNKEKIDSFGININFALPSQFIEETKLD